MSHSAGVGADRVGCGAVAANGVRLEGACGTAKAPALTASRLLAGPQLVAHGQGNRTEADNPATDELAPIGALGV